MIEVVVNDRLGKKVRVKCLGEDSVGDFKKSTVLANWHPTKQNCVAEGWKCFKRPYLSGRL
nr:CMF_HP1_G0048560.mRNA.1.CDS.1 [Saccharomyces cerevisiae]